MAITMTEALQQTAAKYRMDLLMMPVVGVDASIKHMTLRTGIQGTETVGELGNDAELKPYKSASNKKDSTTLELRELQTYLGDVEEEIDLIKMTQTLWGGKLDTDAKKMKLAKKICDKMVMIISKKLNKNLFKASRNADGTTTGTLFNGFSTIAAADKLAGKIATAKGNYASLGIITIDNVVDVLMGHYEDNVSEELQEEQVKMFIPRGLYNLYNKGYKNEFGFSPYNKEYKKTFLEGTDDKCELVPLSGLSGLNEIYITTKDNMLVGVCQESNREKVEINRFSNKTLDFFMVMYFGVQFETISKEKFCFAEFSYS